MTIEEINPVFIAVAKAYNFEVGICPILDRVFIKDSEFYWDASYGEEDFWSELKRTFYDAGAGDSSRW